MWHLTACKFSASLSILNLIKNEMIFYPSFELMLATLIQKYDKNHLKNNKMYFFVEYDDFEIAAAIFLISYCSRAQMAKIVSTQHHSVHGSTVPLSVSIDFLSSGMIPVHFSTTHE